MADATARASDYAAAYAAERRAQVDDLVATFGRTEVHKDDADDAKE